MTFNPSELRDKHGQWVHFPEIHASDLSTPDARRSPEVSPEGFQFHARKGAAKMARLKANSSPASALEGPSFKKIADDAYKASRDPWGGVTVDAHTGKHVPDGLDAYALTMRNPGKDSVHVDPKASREEFDNAMDEARKRFSEELSRPGAHLGVFHDQDINSIDIDPVLVTPKLEDVHDIGAYTHAVGGAYHFKSGDGYWPPHVKDKAMDKSLSVITPNFTGEFDLASGEGRIAFWKQILPKGVIHYTAKDGSRQTMNFSEEYLHDLANNRAKDKVDFMLADVDNRHTMDPERWRGNVETMEVRENGLWGKIVFPSVEAARAVLENPDLGVSARIREGIQKSDGSTVSRGIIHVLGTLDPQVSGMSGWQQADLSTSEDDVLDLSNETFEKEKAMALKKPVGEYTDEEIDQFDEDELNEYLEAALAFLDGTVDSDDADEVEDDLDDDEDEDGEDEESEPKSTEKERTPEMALSNETRREIDLANARATDALRRMAEAEWKAEREAYLAAGVPPHLLDLSAPVLNRPDEMIVDLSNTDGPDAEVDVSKVVRGLLDAAKGTIDLSAEQGHSGTFKAGDGEDPDAAALAAWDKQF